VRLNEEDSLSWSSDEHCCAQQFIPMDLLLDPADIDKTQSST